MRTLLIYPLFPKTSALSSTTESKLQSSDWDVAPESSSDGAIHYGLCP
jgi:hypothetical protein